MLKKIRGPLLLLLAAVVWGLSFVAQDLASDSIGTFTFNGLRMTLGGLALLPIIFVKNKGKMMKTVPSKKSLLLGGALCGSIVFLAASLQQAGISAGTSAGKSGFITAMYVIMVPLVGLFLKKKQPPAIFVCVACAAVGMYFLCMADFSAGWSQIGESLKMSRGDLLTFACAVCFTFHILFVDHFAAETDGVFLSSMQFLFAGGVALVAMLIWERPGLADIYAARYAILYAALFSCGVGYTLQILGQKTTPPAIASIMMCLESVFAVLFDALLLKTPMSLEEILGCVLMFAAILSCNLIHLIPQKKKESE